ncbi:MAG TPA: SRPBCC domain-containing protein [Actinomycetota bacterium]|nr:SRPBCC domain-containing protein [Actinomycetota bacterium]
MAVNERVVDAPVDLVWSVLTDASTYPRWVVGARRFRYADPDWPEPGSAFHHEVGVGPLRLRDETRVESIEPSRRIVLLAKARPMGMARVAIEIAGSGHGTRVRLEERGAGPLTAALWNPVLDRLTWLRNVESLRRFEGVVRDAAPSA